MHTKFVTKGITYAPCSSLVELPAEKIDLLGVSPDLRKKVVFINPGYQQKNSNRWNSSVNELKAE